MEFHLARESLAVCLFSSPAFFFGFLEAYPKRKRKGKVFIGGYSVVLSLRDLDLVCCY